MSDAAESSAESVAQSAAGSAAPAGSAPVVVLVGAMGAGKTSVGQVLAQRLDVAFRDTDVDIEAAADRTISDIFVTDGEDRFRVLEAEAVGRALDEHTGVLALGGGAVLDPRTRERLGAHRVVWLKVGLSASARRVGLARDRPLLISNPRARLRQLLADRDILYAEVATYEVGTDERTVDEVTDAVRAALCPKS